MKLITQAGTDQEPRKLPSRPFYVIGKDSGTVFIVTDHISLNHNLFLTEIENGKRTTRAESRADILNQKGYRLPLPGEKIVIEF